MKQKVELNNKTILATGFPGFIGANLVLRLIKELDCGFKPQIDKKQS